MSILNKLTLAQLKENKRRTFLTGFSIAILVSLLTAIILFLTSGWHFMRDSIANTEGDWHFRTTLINSANQEQLKSASFVDSLTTVPATKADSVQYNSKTYSSEDIVLVTTTPETKVLTDNLTLYLASGISMPKENEIVLTMNFNDEELASQDLLNKKISFTVNGITKEFTVVGILVGRFETNYAIINTNTFNSTSSIAFGKSNQLNSSFYDTLKNYTTATQNQVIFEDTNGTLLSIYFVRNDSVIDGLKSVALVIMIIMLVISVAVINSGFTLSLNERIKQIGALSSIGSTRKQIRRLMLLEAAWIGSIAITVGLVIGFIGTIISLHFFDGFAQTFIKLQGTQEGHFSLHIFWPAILGVIVFSIFMVLLSALIPSLRAASRPAIDNIKQVPFKNLFKFRKNNPKKTTRSFFGKTFGAPGHLAHRYQKHNKSRSRIAFVILTISLITFNVIANAMIQTTDAISQTASSGFGFRDRITAKFDAVIQPDIKNTKIFDAVKNLDGVESSMWLKEASLNGFLEIEKNNFMTKEQLEVYSSPRIATLSPEAESELLKAANVSKEDFEKGGILITYPFVNSFGDKRTLINPIEKDLLKNKKILLTQSEKETNKRTTQDFLPILSNLDGSTLALGATNVSMFFISNQNYQKMLDSGIGIYPMYSIALQIQDEKLISVKNAVTRDYPDVFFYDAYSIKQILLSVLGMMQIIAYGFLSLVSLVCLTTLFNTMTSQIHLRRREFAILRSVGTTMKQLRLMLTIENLKTGVWALLVSILISIGLTFLIFSNINRDILNQSFSYPLLPTIISSTIFIGTLLLFNFFSMRQALNRSLVEDIADETL